MPGRTKKITAQSESLSMRKRDLGVLQGLFLTKTKVELFAMVDMTEQRVEAFEDDITVTTKWKDRALWGCAMGSNLEFQLFN